VQRRSLLAAAAGAPALPFIGRAARAQTASVAGAGSALPRAVFQKWVEMARGANMKVAYEVTGAPAAVEQLKNRTIDFASVDFPRRSSMLRENHLIQFPTVLTGVMPFVNLPGVADGQLRLTGDVLADMFLGKITKWDDARIKALNDGVNLPATGIVPVHRTDSAGATMLFTTYLSRESEAWAAGPRAGTIIQWPANVGAAADGLEASAAKVKSTPGAIGFAGVTTVKEHKFTTVSLKNRAGEFVKADGVSFSKAAYSVDWTTAAFNVDMVDTDAAGAWPIVGANYVLVPDNPTAEKVEAARNTFKFFDWAFKNGYAAATELNYPAIPSTTCEKIAEVWRRAKDPSGRPIWEA
jgi:phosphate transport system substrate-binding protein